MTHVVATAVNIEFGSQNDTGDQGEEGSKAIANHEDDWNVEGFHDRRDESEEEDKPGKDGNEDGIVDA